MNTPVEAPAPLGPKPLHEEHRPLPQGPLAEAHGGELARELLYPGRRDLEALLGEGGGCLGGGVLAVERLHDHDFDRAKSEILAGLGVFDDVALLAPVGLLYQHEVVAELGPARHGLVRTTFSPGARPLTTSIRSPPTSLPRVSERSVVRSSDQTNA